VGNTEINIFRLQGAIVFKGNRGNPRQSTIICFFYTVIVAFRMIASVLSRSFTSSERFQEKINAKFGTIYGPVFGIGFVSLLCYTHGWPDRSE
jgi:hypothetical protein